ncbi:hypothetical protein J0895_02260 [Phormidium pseudopriestleyi FRX01]|uniref:MotA/TolQ/ExbB proton channel domain-containing protein n=1 Tax=Phormidium pseudopriestleyi FRX01 TaxID=1759528 RepID=A0ABS3FLG0_9CYAN|nr:hypothetical protein [Phormidium pseudopriestleyi]MBO0347944.1 hypothetical protein [Phormidium pseudopriestleyi FRX01]
MPFHVVGSIIWNNTVFHGLVLLVFLAAVFVEIYQTIRYRHETQLVATALGFLKNWQRDKNNLPKPQISTWLSDHILLDNYQQPIQQNGYFILQHYPQVLQISPRSSLQLVPNLCTAIGILGTFYGIQAGLQGVSFGVTQSSDLLAAIQTLLMGMRTAFSSSLMGLGLGSIFTVVLFGTNGLRQSWRDRLRIQIDRLFILEPNPSALNRAQTPQTGTQGQPIVTELTPVLEKISTALEAIASKENPHPTAAENSAVIQQLSQTLTTLSQDFNRLLVVIETQHRETGDRLEKISTKLQETLQTNLQQTLRDRAQLEQQMLEQLHQRTLELLTQASTSFQQQSHTLETVGTEASTLIQTAKIELIVGLQEMNETLLTTNQTMENYLEQCTEIYQSQLQDFFSQTVQIMESQRRAFRQSTADAADTFDGLREALEAALDHRVKIEQMLLEEWRNGVNQRKSGS